MQYDSGLTVSLLISSEDFIEQVFLSWWIVHHYWIMEGDTGVSQAPSVVQPLIKTSIYELWNLRDYYLSHSAVGTMGALGAGAPLCFLIVT